MPKLLRVLFVCVLPSALAIAGCGKPAPLRHPAVGDWRLVGDGGVDLAELKFFPNGKCRLTQSGEKMRFCGWDPAAEPLQFEMRFGALLPILNADGRVEGDEMALEYTAGGRTNWVRAGSSIEQSVKGYLRGAALVEAGDYARGLAEWTKAADHGDATIQNNLAWLLATAKDPKLHDGKKAIAYAEKAVARERSAMFLDTLAAALARDGQFERAIQAQEEALTLVQKNPPPAGDTGDNTVQQYTERLALYKAGQAYSEP
jgi:tetratricopeptide (TPR) repeat protein